MLVLAAGIMLRDLAHPYHTPAMLRSRALARWFWLDVGYDCELVCLNSDCPTRSPERVVKQGWRSLFLCNQRIYSPPLANAQGPDWDRVSGERPLRCVWYRSSAEKEDNRSLEAWLDEMQSQYVLVARDEYPMPAYDKTERQTWMIDYLDVFKFVPRQGMARGASPGSAGGPARRFEVGSEAADQARTRCPPAR